MFNGVVKSVTTAQLTHAVTKQTKIGLRRRPTVVTAIGFDRANKKSQHVTGERWIVNIPSMNLLWRLCGQGQMYGDDESKWEYRERHSSGKFLRYSMVLLVKSYIGIKFGVKFENYTKRGVTELTDPRRL